MFRYGTGHGANWHPTVGTHLYRGELIAWMLLLTILDSLYMIKDDIEAGVILTANLHQSKIIDYLVIIIILLLFEFHFITKY